MTTVIIFHDFVVNAVYKKFKNNYNFLTFDLNKMLCNSSFNTNY